MALFVIGLVGGLLIGGCGVFFLWMYDRDRVQDKWEQSWWEDHHPGIPWPMADKRGGKS